MLFNETINKEHLFPYEWKLSDGYPAKGISNNGYNVFGTFVCGGGSTMGYKLAGFNHYGGVELDKKLKEIYIQNHSPKHYFLEDIRDFNLREDLPAELYNLDILDGSPPCSSFSVSGNREKDWGKEKKFAEGQKMQKLDDLVFVYCDTILKLRPKVFVLENVKGLLQGRARHYLNKIRQNLTDGGYFVNTFLLNSSNMGVPQERERVFIVGAKKEYNLPTLELSFNEKQIPFKEYADYNGESISKYALEAWMYRRKDDRAISDSKKWAAMKISDMNTFYVHDDCVCNTLTSKGKHCCLLYSKPIRLSTKEHHKIGTFPIDYNWFGAYYGYVIGMSVPPVMMAQVSNQIRIQWIDKIYGK